jgi:hypothetical protein
MTIKEFKVSWQAVTFGVPLILTVVVLVGGWVVSVETRLSVSDRVDNLEELINPLLVEWKVQQRLVEEGVCPIDHEPPTPDPPPPVAEVEAAVERIRVEATGWADDVVQMKR